MGIINYAVTALQPRYDTVQHGCGGIWAPSIRYHDGNFYIYYGDTDLGLMMTCTDNIYGEWTPLICVKEGKGLIDPCPLRDDDSRAYIVHAYANSRCGIMSKLAVCEMTEDFRYPGVRTYSWTVFMIIIQEYACTLPGLKNPKIV